jgi:DNA-binding beta-propeller fold protein YncE
MKHGKIAGKRPLRAMAAIAAVALLGLATHPASAGDKPFPKRVPALFGSLPEGFAIGRGATAFNGSVDGSIYKVDLRSGKGEILVPPEDSFDPVNDCYKLGMRVDPRTNYLFVAGCVSGNAYVFDADNGALLATYSLPGSADDYQIINDLAITKDAVYFTDSQQALLYRLPLSKNGGLPADPNAATAIPLVGDFVNKPSDDPCCGANGIVATPDGKTLIVGHSNFSQLFKVDPATGYADEIEVISPLTGFLDGLVMRGRTVYVLTPGFDVSPEGIPDDMIQVVTLGKKQLSGQLSGIITDPDMDGVASGAMFGRSLYVNNARYFADLVSDKWITKLDTRAAE